jgi:solute carrier family 39 (zinc transporter), member 1/2/3
MRNSFFWGGGGPFFPVCLSFATPLAFVLLMARGANASQGAALGAQEDVTQSLHIFIAIQAHKGLAAYALGSSIVDSKASSAQFWSVIGFFSLATPVGIFLGYVLSAVTTADGAACISALASGAGKGGR